MKPRSLIGPMLLILIGVLFLLHNLRPDLLSFAVLAMYWPYILIAWGVIRLIEIGFWRMSKKPLPRSGVSGGEWALVVLICLIGLGTSAAHRYGPRLPPLILNGRGIEFFGEPFDYPLSASKPVSNVKRLVIENLHGNARVVGGDVTTIQVTGRKTIRAFQQSDADEADRKTPLEVIVQGEDVIVKTNQDKAPEDRRVSADIELTVPRNLNIRATGRRGDFDILGINGDVEVESGNAGVRLQDIAGKVRVDLHRSDVVRAVNVKKDVEILGKGGDIELENIEGKVILNGYFSGDMQCRDLKSSLELQSGGTELRFAKLPGQLHMDLGDFTATKIVGPVRLAARSRDIRIEDFTDSLELRIERGDIELFPKQMPNGSIDVTTGSGNIELALPAQAKFELSATALRGEVTNDFGPTLKLVDEGRKSLLRGGTGKGPKITIATDRGSITVRKD